jgi:hypothetical protein
MISLCPQGHTMKIQFHSQQRYDQANCTNTGQVPQEGKQKWETFIQLIREGRNIGVVGWGRASECESVQELTFEYVVSALGGQPALLAPG